MKIAITAREAKLDAEFDTRFGRAQVFALYDSESKNLSALDNSQNLEASQGAGVQAAQTLIDAGVKVLVSGHCGPKAFKVLQAAGIKVYQAQAKTVGEAIELFTSEKLTEIKAPDVEGHWV